LINTRALVNTLSSIDTSTVTSISYHRVIDNEKITMKMEDVFIHLNLHLIHALDFLPSSNWKANMHDVFVNNFLILHKFLTDKKKLFARVDFDITSMEDGEDDRSTTLASVLLSVIPSSFIRRTSMQAQEKLSRKIGHSTNFEIHYAL